MPKSRNPLPLPDALIGEAPSVKLLYLWLAQHDEVDMSQRAIARALGITQANVSLALGRLLSLGLVERSSEAGPRLRSALSVVRSITPGSECSPD